MKNKLFLVIGILILIFSIPVSARAGVTGADSLAVKHPHLSAFVQMLGVNLTLWAHNRYIMQEPWARISLNSVKRNYEHGWVLDDNNFNVNQFGHPLQGSLVYTAARAQGLSLWQSSLYPILSSYMWEMAMETEYPSVNDMLTTPLSGITYGEISHRLSLLILGDNPGWGKELAALIVNPSLGLNRLLRGRKGGFYKPIRAGKYAAGFSYGSGGYLIDEQKWMTSRQFLRAHIFYGDPFKSVQSAKPFDYFSFIMILNIGLEGYVGEIYTSGNLKSLLVNRRPDYSYMIGIFKDYDFMNQDQFKVSSSSIGPGIVQNYTFDSGVRIDNEILISGIIIGSAGNVAQTGVERDYFYGPGISGKILLMLTKQNWGRIYLRLKRYFIMNIEDFRTSRYENVNLIKTGVQIPLWRQIAFGAEFTLATRKSVEGNPPFNSQKRGIVQFHLIYNIQSSY